MSMSNPVLDRVLSCIQSAEARDLVQRNVNLLTIIRHRVPDAEAEARKYSWMLSLIPNYDAQMLQSYIAEKRPDLIAHLRTTPNGMLWLRTQCEVLVTWAKNGGK